MERTKLLLCEDDANLGLLLAEYLRDKGYDVRLYADGDTAYKGFTKEHYDLCILNVVMPGKDGISLSREIRSMRTDIPIILLTARNMHGDILEAFKAGADDYMAKPFSLEELVLRIEAKLRRSGKDSVVKEQQLYCFHNMEFDSKKQFLTIDGRGMKLTTKESELLALLCSRANNILERSYALRKIWKEETFYAARSMDVYITRLRKLLKPVTGIEIINIHGKGYKLLVRLDM
ncbi:MAG: response regulator transcription factor [Prevotella sp.]|jgi:DNA-binding response OmpR family regulator|nr:response regulator transcription factor [Prevotella sp.]